MKRLSMRHMAQAGVIAALYAGLTLLLRPISYGVVQVRVSEALTLLPVFTQAAPIGLFIGCLLANMLGGATLLDIVLGSLATFSAAWLTRRLRDRPILAALPPIAVNAVVVGFVLHVAYGEPVWMAMGSVAVGQTVSCLGLGLPMVWALRKLPARFFA